MTSHEPQVPWTDEQWARVNQVIQEEANRARVAATFLPLYGPLPADTDFVRAADINYPPQPAPPPAQRIAINDQTTIQLATLQVKVDLRAAQVADPEMTSVLALFRRAANVLARLEDVVVFRGLMANLLGAGVTPPAAAVAGLPQIWEISGGQVSPGLLNPAALQLPAQTQIGPLPPPPPSEGHKIAAAVAVAIGLLEANGHFGPFAVIFDNNYFAHVQSPPAAGMVLPQDQIIPFLGGGPLLRTSALPLNNGLVVALGGAPIELVVAADVCLQFLQLTSEPRYLFRVREKIALRIKEAGAIVTLA